MQEYNVKNGFSLFWGGPYSQWEYSLFTYNGIEFNCCEQFMMFFKALVCGDLESAVLILLELFPKEQKALGRKVKNFDEEKWNKEVSMAVVYIGNYLKFSTDRKFWDYIVNDPSKEIVEASPVDRIWGIGLNISKPQAWHKNSWRGENRLGECLTDVRAILKLDIGEENEKSELFMSHYVKGMLVADILTNSKFKKCPLLFGK
jgi:ribA/ribD-fused uncharacterized protein